VSAHQQAISQVATSLFAAGAAERIIVASLPRNRAAMHLDRVFTFCGPETVTAFTRVTDTIVPFSLRPDDATSSGLDIRREEKPFVETLEAALDVRFQVVPQVATSSARSGSSGTTATTWWATHISLIVDEDAAATTQAILDVVSSVRSAGPPVR
jgi:arginine deiminase